MGVADDEGHRHGLAQRAAKPEHNPADDADAGVRQHDVAHDLPSGAADAVGGFLQHGRHDIEHIARDRGDEGEHHDREDQARRQDADAVGRASKQRRQHGDIAEDGNQGWLQGLLQERREYEQAPDAVDDAGNAGQQLNGDPNGPPQPHWAQLGQKHSDQQPDRDRDQHRNKRRDEGAVDRRERAEFLHNRVPALLDKEVEAESAERRQRAVDEGNNDAAEDDQHPERRGAGENAEDEIDATQPIKRFGPRGKPVGRDHIALQRDVDHGQLNGPLRRAACPMRPSPRPPKSS